MEVGGRQEGAEVQGKTVHLKDGARRLPQVAARVRYARLMVVRAVVNNRHGQQGHLSNKPTPRPSGCVNTTASGRIYLRLLLRRDLDTTIGFTEPGASVLGLSRPRTADSLGLRLW
jgi:hypothetical protein